MTGEASFHKQEQWTRYIIDSSHLGLWNWDMRENWIDCNHIVRELFDWPPDLKITYDILIERIHPEDRERVAQKIQQALSERKEYNAEYRIIWPDGNIHWIAARGFGTEYDQQGNAIRMTGIVANNDERMYLADRLREQTEKLEKALARSQMILESINDVFVSIDYEGHFMYINQNAAKLLGKTPQELLMKRIGDEFPTYRGSELETLVQKTIKTGQPQKAFSLYLKAFNLWLNISTYPSREGISMYGQDVTELVHADQTLRASEAKFRRLVDSNIIGVYINNAEGYILEANHALLSMLGYSPDEFVPGTLHWTAVIHPTSHHLAEPIGKEIKETGKTKTYEFTLMNRQGEVVPVVMAGALLEDNTGNTIWFALDITVQKQLEKQREKFMNMAGHELRNPLAAVKGNLELLQRKMLRMKNSGKALTSEQMASHFGCIDRALSQVGVEARLIDDLIDSARATTDHIKIQLNLEKLDTLVEGTIHDFRLQYPEREMRLHLPAATPVTVLLDCDRIKQVISNLITNALKYSPADQPIDVRLSLEHQSALLEVQDRGSGLSEEEQQSIWMPYYQTGKEATEMKGEVGLGLGLAITQKIIAEHGGRIGLDSELGHGSTFWFTLPLAQ
jgi:PAS domain S-box-containing protein